MLETGACELAAGRMADTDIQALRAHVEKMRLAHENNDLAAFVEADLAFHDLILQASENVFVAVLFEPLHRVLEKRRTETSKVPEIQEHAIGHHQNIADALASRDPHRARDAMDAHMQQTLDDLKTFVLAEGPRLTRTRASPGCPAQASERKSFSSSARSRLGSSCCMQCCRPVAMMENPALSRALETAASWVTTLLQSRPSSIILVTAASCPWARRSRLMTGFMSVGSSSIGSSGSMRRAPHYTPLSILASLVADGRGAAADASTTPR